MSLNPYESPRTKSQAPTLEVTEDLSHARWYWTSGIALFACGLAVVPVSLFALWGAPGWVWIPCLLVAVAFMLVAVILLPISALFRVLLFLAGLVALPLEIR